MSVAKWFGALAIGVGVGLGSAGLYSMHQALLIRRAAYVSVTDVEQYSTRSYAYRGMALIGVGVVSLLAGIIGIAQGSARSEAESAR